MIWFVCLIIKCCESRPYASWVDKRFGVFEWMPLGDSGSAGKTILTQTLGVKHGWSQMWKESENKVDWIYPKQYKMRMHSDLVICIHVVTMWVRLRCFCLTGPLLQNVEESSSLFKEKDSVAPRWVHRAFFLQQSDDVFFLRHVFWILWGDPSNFCVSSSKLLEVCCSWSWASKAWDEMLQHPWKAQMEKLQCEVVYACIALNVGRIKE